jgi:hypothetical protein
MKYPVNQTVEYTNDKEYRICLRQLFEMADSSRDQDNDIDDLTLDELNFDNDATTQCLDYIYLQTKNDSRFQELYLGAAAVMFSTDPEIGLVVLFSYDSLMYFHSCLCCFFRGESVETNIEYMVLKDKFCK